MVTETPLLAVVLFGMGVVFLFLVFLSAMMVALTAVAGRQRPAPGARQAVAEPAGPGSPAWIAAATAAFLAAERDAGRLPSAAAWRPYDTADAVRWRLGAVPFHRGGAPEWPAAP